MGHCQADSKWLLLPSPRHPDRMCRLSILFSYLVSTVFFSMEQISSWESNGPWASQEIPRILWNRNVHNRIQKILPLVHVLSHINPTHVISSHLFKIYFNIILYLPPGLPSSIFSSVFPSKILYAFLFSPYVSMPRPPQPPWLGSTDFLSVVVIQQLLYTDDQPPAGAKVKDVWTCPVSLHGQAAMHGASSPFELF